MAAITSSATTILGFRRRSEAFVLQSFFQLSSPHPARRKQNLPSRPIVIFLEKKSGETKLSASRSDSSDSNSSGGRSSGPPLPTILAGLLVFLLLFWILGSILLWLVGLILNPPGR